MPKYAESNACGACARSKRKCGRQMPSCIRCTDRGTSCVYPLSTRSRASSRPLLPEVPNVEDGALADVFTDDFMMDLAFPLANPAFTPATRPDWFLKADTWNISHDGNAAVAAIGKATMKKYIALVQSWFERWVTTGSNPFIHHSLYSASFPTCTQVAYATLSSYVHRTLANTDTVLQIVEDRSNELLQSWDDREEQDVDLFAQLTRLHALMVYQIIGLFDGDIRSRYVAEGHIAVQNRWANKLFRSAGETLSDSGAAAIQLVGCLPIHSTYLQQQWYLWILSESIRRTWLVAVSLSSIFSALQQRWAECPGGIMFSNRSGLWDAQSASGWEKQCLRQNVAFLQRFECDMLFDETTPADVDEFGTAMLDMTFSGEVLDKWRDTRSSLLGLGTSIAV
jgi:hypothetical protein